MSLLEDLLFSLCQAGPEDVDGVGNYHLSVFGRGGNTKSGSETPLAALYFVDPHGQVPSHVKDPDYDAIKQSQIDWFTRTSQALRRTREDCKRGGDDAWDGGRAQLSLVFLSIFPSPEFEDKNLVMAGGQRRELTEGPSSDSRFYDALVREGVVAVVCRQTAGTQFDPWLCYGGGCGFSGYCSHGGNRHHRRTRVWELDTETGGIKTWKRVEYSPEKVDELVLVEAGAVVDLRAPQDTNKGDETAI